MNEAEGDAVCEHLLKRRPINQRCFSLNGIKWQRQIGKRREDDSPGFTHIKYNAALVCAYCFSLMIWKDWTVLSPPLPPSSRRIAGDTALCKNIHESVSRQMRKNFAKSKWRVSMRLHLSWLFSAKNKTKQKTHTIFYFSAICLSPAVCLDYTRLITTSLRSKPLTRPLWSATWDACSWAPALAAASQAPTLCPALRAELQPRASLWTAPRSPWRTVSDISHF